MKTSKRVWDRLAVIFLLYFFIDGAYAQDNDSNSGSSSAVGFECNEESWDDYVTTCGTCRVLTGSAHSLGSCNWFCGAQQDGLICIGAWEEVDNTCAQSTQYSCGTDFYAQLGTSDMICECASEENEPDKCSVKPDWDLTSGGPHGRYCGSCKAVTFTAWKYRTCEKFCAEQEDGRACKAAWTDYNGRCGIDEERSCDFDFFDCYLQYCNDNPEIRKKLCSGPYCSTPKERDACKTHWETEGKAMGLEPNPEYCDCYLQYCNANKELRDQFCGGDYCYTVAQRNSCQEHWETKGKALGMKPNPDQCGAMICECSAEIHGELFRQYNPSLAAAMNAEAEALAKKGRKRTAGIVLGVLFVVCSVALGVYLACDLARKKNAAIQMGLRAPLTPPRASMRIVGSHTLLEVRQSEKKKKKLEEQEEEEEMEEADEEEDDEDEAPGTPPRENEGGL
eukprot:g17081.t1